VFGELKASRFASYERRLATKSFFLCMEGREAGGGGGGVHLTAGLLAEEGMGVLSKMASAGHTLIGLFGCVV
jgi:hypothetical protein